MVDMPSDRELSIEEYGKKTFLRPVQRQELERSIAGMEDRLTQPMLLEITGGDRAALEKQLVKERGMLARGTPAQLDMTRQRRIYKKMQKCEDIIVNGLPTFTMMERGRPQDVDHHVAHENAKHRDEDGHYTTKRAIQAWKNYRLTLDPNSVEPNYLTIASLRTDHVRGNPALFRQNFDHIRFKELVEESVNQVDDESYYLFCGLKMLDWAEKTIRRKLDWTQGMYDAAMERWRSDMQRVGLQQQADDEVESADTVESEDEVEPEPVISSHAVPEKRDLRHHTPGRLLQTLKEPRVQISRGWPKNELLKYGIGVGEFCKEWGHSSNTLYYKFTKNGLWVERHLKTARIALAKLIKKHQGEPGIDEVPEPALVYESIEPVAVAR
mgnify:FL=1